MSLKLYRVSSITAPYEDFSQVRPDRLEAASCRGTDVHEYLYCYALGLWSPRPDGAGGYCESGERWLDQNLKTIISAEREYQDSILGFCGHPDLLMEDQRGGILLVDYKTPVIEARSWGLKLSAYHYLVCKHHKLKKNKVAPGALMLSPTGGSARFKPYYEQIDYYFGLFLSALNLMRFFKEGKND